MSGFTMTAIGYRRALTVACVFVVALLGLGWHLTMKLGVQRADVRNTWNVIVDYGRSRDVALRSEPEDAVAQLYWIAYMPPRRTNSPSPLIRIVERERERNIQDVIAYLRVRTGQDLGDDPARWIEKYSPQRIRPSVESGRPE